jgi:hypothetical protein
MVDVSSTCPSAVPVPRFPKEKDPAPALTVRDSPPMEVPLMELVVIGPFVEVKERDSLKVIEGVKVKAFVVMMLLGQAVTEPEARVKLPRGVLLPILPPNVMVPPFTVRFPGPSTAPKN